MSVRFKNRLKTMSQYNLPHEQCCSGAQCFCKKEEALVWTRNDRGQQVQVYRNQLLAASIIIPGGQISDEYPEAVLLSPEIQQALARRDLVAIQ